MREENYLYFANAGGNDTDKDMAMFPASTFRGAVTMSSNSRCYERTWCTRKIRENRGLFNRRIYSLRFTIG